MKTISCLNCCFSFTKNGFALHFKKCNNPNLIHPLSLKRKQEYELNPKVCNFCEKLIPYENRKSKKKFCSLFCALSFNKGKPRRPQKRKSKKIKKCLKCKNIISGKGNKFCSLKCQISLRIKENILKWLNKEISGHDKFGALKDWVKRYIKQIYGEKCSLCGWAEINPTSGRIPLHVDHIDGNWRNSWFENLRILCPNCHSLTPTYGSLNKDGRKNASIKSVRKGLGSPKGEH